MNVKMYLILSTHLQIQKKELFEAKQIFMFSVLDKQLLTNMGKTIVRKYVHTTDAQYVWKKFQEHMKSSSKGASEKEKTYSICQKYSFG